MRRLSTMFGGEVFWNRPGEWRAVRALTRHHVRRFLWLYAPVFVLLFLCLLVNRFVPFSDRAFAFGGTISILVLWPALLGCSRKHTGAAKTLLGLSFTQTAVAGWIWVLTVLITPLLFGVAELLSISVMILNERASAFELLTVLPDTCVVMACCAVLLFAFSAIPAPHVVRFFEVFRLFAYLFVFVGGAVGIRIVTFYVNHGLAEHAGPFSSVSAYWTLATFAMETVASLAVVYASLFAATKLLLKDTWRPRSPVQSSTRVTNIFQREPGARLSPCRFVLESIANYKSFTLPVLVLWLVLFYVILAASDAAKAKYVEWPAYWFLLFLVLCTVGQVVRWLASLRCLRMLPWTPTRLAWFVLSGPIFVATVVFVSGLIAFFPFGASLPVGWMTLALTAPLFGLLLTPRTGAGAFIIGVALGFTLIFVLVMELSASPILLALAVATSIGGFLRLRGLIHSQILYKAHAMDFLAGAPRR